MKLLSLCLLTSCLQAAGREDYFNILSIDGGGIRGLIPTQVIMKMEKYAFEYAKEQKYFRVPVHDDHPEVVAMKDLFDMMAGTSTGSILAAGLVYPTTDE
jgi:patatin-like phospholipase/acyl hydrolase